jgi:hypothetical protein
MVPLSILKSVGVSRDSSYFDGSVMVGDEKSRADCGVAVGDFLRKSVCVDSVYEFVDSLWENRFPEEERAFMRCGRGEVVKFFQV